MRYQGIHSHDSTQHTLTKTVRDQSNRWQQLKPRLVFSKILKYKLYGLNKMCGFSKIIQ